jgi:hypothetical protein
MSIVIIILLILSVLGLGLTIFKVQVDQRTVNTLVFFILISIICYIEGWIKF